ncbi:DinB family protein [Lutibacter sp. B1]|uniref:DinB family protein n=1 Tax=Lutibacter sp. B1 TaxID=2725996 RepID=UPI001456E0B1|nr:DUF1572 family protein [Lutibacter sp. B1]NLP58090.1 DinB family protein [Lutibacter sp. B1]
MELTKILVIRLNEILLDGKWVTGTNIKNEIIDLDWRKATMKIDSLNSIADITFHIDYYIAGVLNFFENGKLEIKDKYSFDSKPINSQKDWKDLIDKFCDDSEKFVKVVRNMTDKELEKTFADEKYGTILRNINVIIEHSYYHLGQIILIKKLMK